MAGEINPVKGIYAIVDPAAPAGRDPLALTDAVLAAGVTVVQLRAKVMPARELLTLSRALRDRCRNAGALFIVNDRLDVALAAGADGVHLGQDDLPLAAARGLAPDLLIGVSTHSPAEALAAQEGGADYLGFGAMYSTGSKPDVTAPQGPARLAEVVRAVRIPVIAIGGVTREKLPELKAAGAAGAAVISAIAKASDPFRSARELVTGWNRE